MKFRCVKKNLEKVLQKAELFIGKNEELEVLSCILLEAKKGYISIDSTNIDTSFSSEIPVVTETDGKTAVPADIFYKTVSAITDDELQIELKENILNIKSKNSDVQINTLSPEDFPKISNQDEQNENELESQFTLPKKDFQTGLETTEYAVSSLNTKPELASVCFKADKEFIYFVATDGYRLSERVIKNNRLVNDEFKALLPSDTVSAFLKVLNLTDDDILNLTVYKNQIKISTDEFIVFSRLTEGEYIEYSKLIPEDTNTSVIVLKQDFLDAIKLINIFANDFNQVKVKIENKKFTIDTKNNIGQNELTIDTKTVGEDIELSFNYKYIQDVLPSIFTDSFEMIFNPAKPVLIKPVGDRNFKYIVMPLSR